MDTNDFIYYRDEDNNICSGGYKINCALKSQDIPIMQTTNTPFKEQAKDDSQDNLAIPLGLFFLQQQSLPTSIYDKDENISDELYNKLLKLARIDEELDTLPIKQIKRKKTKKYKKKTKKNTRKNH